MEPKPGSSRIPPRGPRTAVGIAEPDPPRPSLLEWLKLFFRRFVPARH
ncbi:MAG: hypothetical protein JST93_04490 [Acidobacteria bacterium]|nr:hypothetical protein [Acidobacteriota bacterium]